MSPFPGAPLNFYDGDVKQAFVERFGQPIAEKRVLNPKKSMNGDPMYTHHLRFRGVDVDILSIPAIEKQIVVSLRIDARVHTLTGSLSAESSIDEIRNTLGPPTSESRDRMEYICSYDIAPMQLILALSHGKLRSVFLQSIP